jgi:hypothetical protein
LIGSQSGASASNTGRIRPNIEGRRFAIPAKLLRQTTNVQPEEETAPEKHRKDANQLYTPGNIK